jgi:hypothetical protein
MTGDKGFRSKFDGIGMICKADYTVRDLLATAPPQYHIHKPDGRVLRLGHLSCVLKARAEIGRVA